MLNSLSCSKSLKELSVNDIWSTLIGGVIGLIGVFVGAWLTARLSVQQQQRQSRIQVVLNLYSEFQSESMLESRIIAFNTFEANISELPLGFGNLHSRVGSDDWFHVSKVIHFFEKYAVYDNQNCFDKSLSKVTLERYFIYWYKKYFKTLVKTSLEQEFEEWGGWAKPVKQLGEKLRI